MAKKKIAEEEEIYEPDDEGLFEGEDFDPDEDEDEDVEIPDAVHSLPSNFVQEARRQGIPVDYLPQMSLLDQCLAGKSDVFRSKVINIMLRSRIKANDPIFLLLLSIGELELILVDTPLTIQGYLSQFAEELGDLFAAYFGGDEATAKYRFETSIQESKTAIAEAAQELIKISKEEQFYGSFEAVIKSLAPALGILVLAIGLGAVGTIWVQNLFGRSLIPAGKLTAEQYEILKWAETDEGKLAKNIMDWNQGYVGKTCKEDAIAMGLGLNSNGRKVKSGFCVLFVEPPDKRKYE
jgi:hypothetical protein